MKRILILLSTYNGERFLACQLDSLRTQVGVEVHYLIRDDGSSDGTVAILESFARTTPRVSVRRGVNIGWAASFHQLTQWAWEEYRDRVDFFAYCDQDDRWQADKLLRATEALSTKHGPALYLSNVELANEELVSLGLCRAIPTPGMTLEQMFVDVFCLGCTFCFNRDLLAVWSNVTNEVPPSHDRWLFLLAKLVGSVVCDERPSLLYRQHGANACGGIAASATPLVVRISKMIKDRHLISSHLVKLNCVLAGRDFREKHALSLLAACRDSWMDRFRVFCQWEQLGLKRSNVGDDLKKRLKVLLGFL